MGTITFRSIYDYTIYDYTIYDYTVYDYTIYDFSSDDCLRTRIRFFSLESSSFSRFVRIDALTATLATDEPSKMIEDNSRDIEISDDTSNRTAAPGATIPNR